MRLIDIPETWIHTREGIWHEPFYANRLGKKILEYRKYEEHVCLRCGEKSVRFSKSVKYCTQTCGNNAIKKVGKDHPRWNNGRANIGMGYIMVLVSRKPRKYAMEHRVLMEKKLGRKLEYNEVVHHINGVKNDNRLENLIVMTRAEHALHHRPGDNNKH